MARNRFKDVGIDSFFEQFAYEQVVPRSHLLVKLNQVINWDVLNDLLIPAYKGLAETGRPSYPPVVLLKMLVIAYLYRFSERQVVCAAGPCSRRGFSSTLLGQPQGATFDLAPPNSKGLLEFLLLSDILDRGCSNSQYDRLMFTHRNAVPQEGRFLPPGGRRVANLGVTWCHRPFRIVKLRIAAEVADDRIWIRFSERIE